jgi:type VI secretion system secreted protein VgrG
MSRFRVTLALIAVILAALGIGSAGAATLEEIQAPPSLPSQETGPPPLKTPLPSLNTPLPSYDTPLPSMESDPPAMDTPLPSMETAPPAVDTPLPPEESGPDEPASQPAEDIPPE